MRYTFRFHLEITWSQAWQQFYWCYIKFSCEQYHFSISSLSRVRTILVRYAVRLTKLKIIFLLHTSMIFWLQNSTAIYRIYCNFVWRTAPISYYNVFGCQTSAADVKWLTVGPSVLVDTIRPTSPHCILVGGYFCSNRQRLHVSVFLRSW